MFFVPFLLIKRWMFYNSADAANPTVVNYLSLSQSKFDIYMYDTIPIP